MLYEHMVSNLSLKVSAITHADSNVTNVSMLDFHTFEELIKERGRLKKKISLTSKDYFYFIFILFFSLMSYALCAVCPGE